MGYNLNSVGRGMINDKLVGSFAEESERSGMTSSTYPIGVHAWLYPVAGGSIGNECR